MFFFFNDTATTEIYTLSLHDALPILELVVGQVHDDGRERERLADREIYLPADEQYAQSRRYDRVRHSVLGERDRKSTRLNSSHANISYAVFCLKKKQKILLPLTSATT